MDTFKSIQSETQKIMEKIHCNMVTEVVRKANESSSLSADPTQDLFSCRTEYIPRQRPETIPSEEDDHIGRRRFTIALKWENAINSFRIGKIYQEALLKNVFMGLRMFAMNWAKLPTETLYLSGPPGCGKTYASIAILKELILQKKYHWIIYTRSDDLDNELLKSMEQKNEAEVIEKYSQVPILFLDDLGTERPTERILKQYLNIIDSRVSNCMPTVYTSNLAIQEVAKTLGDRIASRLQSAYEIIFPKKDYRKQQV